MRSRSTPFTWLARLAPFIAVAPLLSAFPGGVSAPDLGSPGSILRAAGLSALVGSIAVLVAGTLGLAAGWSLAQRAGALRLACTALPLALAPSVAVSGWMKWIAPEAASSFALPLAGFTSFARTALFSPLGAGLILGLHLWPVVALYSWPGFRAASDEAYAAALTLGSRRQAFWRVAFPRCRGEIAGGMVLAGLLAAGDFSVCSLLLVKSLAVEAHDRIALGKTSAAALLSLPLASLCIAGVVLSAVWNTRPACASGRARPVVASPHRLARAFAWAGLAFGFVIPMSGCLGGVLSSGRGVSAAFNAGAAALEVSLRLAAAVALLSVLCGAARLALRDRAAALLWSATTLFLLSIPGALVAAAALTLQTACRPFFEVPLAWLAAALTLRLLFIPVRLSAAALEHIDASLPESAAVLGASPLARWAGVTLPLSIPHLSAAAALAFVFALGEVPIGAVLAPPGAQPATLWLFNQQHMGYDESVFGLSLLLGAVSAAAVGLGAWAMARASKP